VASENLIIEFIESDVRNSDVKLSIKSVNGEFCWKWKHMLNCIALERKTLVKCPSSADRS